MKIDITERVFHFRQPAGTSRGVYTERRSWFVEVSDGERRIENRRLWGKANVGECAPLPDLSCDARPDYAEVLRGFCDEVERTGEIPYEAMRSYPSMLFGLEMATTHHPSLIIHSSYSIPINGLVWMGTLDEMYARVKEKLDAGFRCVKLKIGAIDWQQEMELIRFVRQHFSTEQVELRVDANGGFSVEDAPRRLEELAKYDIHSIEQPIRQGHWVAMSRLCGMTPLPIALDEELIGVNTREEKVRLLDIIRPQYLVLKPSLHGGIRGTTEWVALARERGIGTWLTSALESNIGLYAIAQLAICLYGSHITFPQGLGTGQLFTDNIPMPIEIKGDKLWVM